MDERFCYCVCICNSSVQNSELVTGKNSEFCYVFKVFDPPTCAPYRDTISTSVDVQARKVEIEQTVQVLQEAQKAHDKAIPKSYEQLRNLPSGDTQPQ
jgi:hypothetical protein